MANLGDGVRDADASALLFHDGVVSIDVDAGWAREFVGEHVRVSSVPDPHPYRPVPSQAGRTDYSALAWHQPCLDIHSFSDDGLVFDRIGRTDDCMMRSASGSIL